MTKTKKIAIYEGSFNPLHNGHLTVITETLRKKIVDEVWILPYYEKAFKGKRNLLPIEHRAKMIALTIEKLDNVYLSLLAVEMAKLEKKPNYSIETVREIKLNYPNFEFYFLLGSKSFYDIVNWHKYKELLNEITLVIFPFCKHEIEKLKKHKLAKKNKSIVVEPEITTTIKSDVLRKLIIERKPFNHLMPYEAYSYFVEKNLHKKLLSLERKQKTSKSK